MNKNKTNNKETFSELENKVITELYLYAIETIDHLDGDVDKLIDMVTDYILERTDKWLCMSITDCKFLIYQFIYRKIKYSKNTTVEIEVPINNVSYVHALPVGAESLWNAVSSLSKREQEIIFYKYVHDMSNIEVSKILGISSSRVYQLDGKALRRLRQPRLLSKYIDIGSLRQFREGCCTPMLMM